MGKFQEFQELKTVRQVLFIATGLLVIAFLSGTFVNGAIDFAIAIGGFALTLYFYALYISDYGKEHLTMALAIVYFSVLLAVNGIVKGDGWYQALGFVGILIGGYKIALDRNKQLLEEVVN